ncbi:MAG: hypothetical protein Hals2KO_05160 [Halioglobus sp.]
MNQAADNSANPAQHNLSASQLRFFHTFGYLLLPGRVRDGLDELCRAFDEVMADPDNGGTQLDYADGDRLMVPAILERHPVLQALKSDARITAIPDSLIGDNWDYAESSGDVMQCETTWHRDVYHSPLQQFHIKLLFYLDPLTADNGALRVLPGTHYYQDSYVKKVLSGQGFPDRMEDVFGIPADALPATPIETQPGDVIVLNFRTVHASFAGSEKRRLLNMNYREPTG